MSDTSENPGATEADDIDAPVEVNEPKLREPTSFEKRLRTMVGKERSGRQAAESALETVKAEAETRVADAYKAAEARLVRAEVKALAVQAGLVDLDALDLIGIKGLKMDDDGNVVGAAEAIEAARKAKPYLFGAANTSSTSAAPRNEPAKEFDARTASAAELAAFERKMGLKQRK